MLGINVTIAASGMVMLISVDKRAIDMLENPINEPIERSNSPAIISSATPTARMPISDETCK